MNQQQRRQLMDAAIEARTHAYAAYSNFAVGAAVLTTNGEIVRGCNVENASYGLANCAERTAIFAAVAGGQREFVALAIATAGGQSPCGACRQVLAEFCDDLPILLVDVNGQQVHETSLAELLPMRFGRS